MTFKHTFLLWIFGWILHSASGAWAKPSVVTTIPELAWLVSEIAKDAVEVQSLLKGTEDPHRVDAVPDYVIRVANADLLVSVGLDLEIGWLPKVIGRSGNRKIHPGESGYCEVGSSLKVLGKPTQKVDRSMGHVHPAGNPHFWLSPNQMVRAGGAILYSLGQLRPKSIQTFDKNYERLKVALESNLQGNREKLSQSFKTQTLSFFEYHQEFAYFFRAYGLNSLGSLEDKPGVPPSGGHLAKVALRAKKIHAMALLASKISPRHHLEKFQELSGVTVLVMPTSMQIHHGLGSYFEFQDRLIEQLVGLTKKKESPRS